MKYKTLIILGISAGFLGTSFSFADENSDKVREIIEMLRKRQAGGSATTSQTTPPAPPVSSTITPPSVSTTTAPPVVAPATPATPDTPATPATLVNPATSITPIIPPPTASNPMPTVPPAGSGPTWSPPAFSTPEVAPALGNSAPFSVAPGDYAPPPPPEFLYPADSRNQDLPIARTIPIGSLGARSAGSTVGSMPPTALGASAGQATSFTPATKRSSRVNIPVIGQSRGSSGTRNRTVSNVSGDSFTTSEIDNIERRLDAALKTAQRRLPPQRNFNPVAQKTTVSVAPPRRAVPSGPRLAQTFPIPPRASMTSIRPVTPPATITSRPASIPAGPRIVQTYPIPGKPASISGTSAPLPNISPSLPTTVSARPQGTGASIGGKPPLPLAQTFPVPSRPAMARPTTGPMPQPVVSPLPTVSDTGNRISTEPMRISEPINPAPEVDRGKLQQLFTDSRNKATLMGSPGSDVTWTDEEWETAKPDAWRYNGEWQSGTMHGKGRLTYKDGWDYFGDWKDGKMHGQGHLTFADGTLYVGEFVYNLPHGNGTITYADGAKFVGEWADGQISGPGVLLNPGN